MIRASLRGFPVPVFPGIPWKSVFSGPRENQPGIPRISNFQPSCIIFNLLGKIFPGNSQEMTMQFPLSREIEFVFALTVTRETQIMMTCLNRQRKGPSTRLRFHV
jgi:hypothetical protein